MGEPYWLEPLPPEGVAAYGLALDGLAADEYASLDGTLDRLGAAGLELLEMVLANPDSWDRYEASQWQTVADWLAANPDDPDHEAMRRYLDENRRIYLRIYLRWGRRYLGWGVFVTRPR